MVERSRPRYGGAHSRRKGRREEQEAASEAREAGYDAERIWEAHGASEFHGWDVLVHRPGSRRLLLQCKVGARPLGRWLVQAAATVSRGGLDDIRVWRVRSDRGAPLLITSPEILYELLRLYDFTGLCEDRGLD